MTRLALCALLLLGGCAGIAKVEFGVTFIPPGVTLKVETRAGAGNKGAEAVKPEPTKATDPPPEAAKP